MVVLLLDQLQRVGVVTFNITASMIIIYTTRKKDKH